VFTRIRPAFDMACCSYCWQAAHSTTHAAIILSHNVYLTFSCPQSLTNSSYRPQSACHPLYCRAAQYSVLESGPMHRTNQGQQHWAAKGSRSERFALSLCNSNKILPCPTNLALRAEGIVYIDEPVDALSDLLAAADRSSTCYKSSEHHVQAIITVQIEQKVPRGCYSQDSTKDAPTGEGLSTVDPGRAPPCLAVVGGAAAQRPADSGLVFRVLYQHAPDSTSRSHTPLTSHHSCCAYPSPACTVVPCPVSIAAHSRGARLPQQSPALR
jgi:hypothetical protein